MAYITTSDLSARLGTTAYARLTDRVNGTTADSTVAQRIVDEAEAEANSYLSRRYATPVDLGTHPELANILALRVLDLAEHIAWRTSPFMGDVPGRIKATYDAASNWFTQVASGAIYLPAASPPASETAASDGPQYRAAERPFTADELDGL